jgi:tripartite ATP-independent transporter DctM subunit
MLIPPSALAVILASIGRISVASMLMAGVIPGILLGGMFAGYIILSAHFNPKVAPPYPSQADTWKNRLILTAKYLLPMGFIIFMVIGLIILGVATPTEAAASGVIATLIVTLIYRRLTWDVIKTALFGTVSITGMIFMIVAASKTFSAILAFTGASSGLLGLVKGMDMHPIIILICMQLIIAFMGTFMETVSIMMICLPVFMPISNALGFDPVWFGILMLINLEMGQITPPFGMLLFVMKGVAPTDVSIADICRAAVPYVLFDVVVMALIIIWPSIALWLPNQISG